MFLFLIGRLIAVLAAWVLCGSGVFAADSSLEPSIIDMRDAAPAAIKRKAASVKPKGRALVYSGAEEKRADIVREISAQSAADGRPVLRVLLARSDAGEGVSLLDSDGDPLDVVYCRLAPKTSSNLRRQKVCTTPGEDAARERGATERTRRRQDGAMTEPSSGH